MPALLLHNTPAAARSARAFLDKTHVGDWTVTQHKNHPEWTSTYAVADVVKGRSVLSAPQFYGYVGQAGPGGPWAWDGGSDRTRGGYTRTKNGAILRLMAAVRGWR